MDVYENGQTRGIQVVDYTDVDVFRITRANGAVNYFHGDQRLYTSRTPSTGVLTVGQSTYATGDTI